MGRDQSVRQHQADSRQHRRHPSQIRQSAQRESNDKKPVPSRFGLVQFFRRYPIALLLVVWVVFLLLAGMAIMDMTSLGAPKSLPDSAPALSPLSPSLPAQPDPGSLPLLSLMAIALSCAGGCMIILQSLKPRRLPERHSTFSKSAAHRPKNSDVKAQSRLQHRAQDCSSPSIAPSVVAADISQPLDWDEPSIADNLDFRQQRPLSHWL